MKKALKRSLSLLLAITIIFGSMYIGLSEVDFGGLFAVKAEAASESDLTFTLNDDGESYSVSDCVESASGTITVPTTYKGKLVTIIGPDAFRNCSKLTLVILPKTILRVEATSFASCSNLKSIAIPDKVVRIGWGAFSYCTNLEKIVLGKSLEYVTNCFQECNKLSTVYYTGTEAEYDDLKYLKKYSAMDRFNLEIANGNGLKNITAKIICNSSPDILKHVSNVSVNTSTKDKKKLTIVDIDNQSGFEGKSISVNGSDISIGEKSILISGDTFGTSNTLSIKNTASEYYNSKVMGKYLDNKEETIYFEKRKSDTKPYVNYIYCKSDKSGSEWKNALFESITVSSSSTETFTIEVGATAQSGSITKYCLAQDGEKTITSLTGSFSQTVLAEKFNPDKPIVVYCIDSKGRTSRAYSTQIKIETSLSDIVSYFDSNSINVFSSNGSTFKIDDDVPIFGGAEVGFDFAKIPVSMSVEGNKYKIAVGVNKKTFTADEWNTYKKGLNDIKDMKDITKKYKQLNKMCEKNNVKSVAGKCIGDGKFDTNFIGYVEFEFIDGQAVITSSYIGCSMNVKYDWQRKYLVLGYPIYTELGVSISTSVSAEAKRIVADKDVPIQWDIKFNFKPSMSLGVGGGLPSYLSVGISGKAEFDWYQEILEQYAKIDFTLSASIKAKAFLLSYEKELASKKWTIISGTYDPVGVSLTDGTSPYYSGSSPEFFNSEKYISLVDRDYVENTEWIGGYTPTLFSSRAISVSGYENSLLQTSIYSDSRQQLVEFDGGKMLVWIMDDATRESANRTKLVYSLYDEGTAIWSEPVAVCDDGTADFLPYVVSDGNNVWVAWQNMNTTFNEETATMDNYSAAAEIYVAKYNGETGEFETAIQVTNNEYVDTIPAITVENGEVSVVWVTNSANDFFGVEGVNTIKTTTIENGGVSDASSLKTDLGFVSSIDCKLSDGVLYVAYSYDLDSDYNDSSDVEMYQLKILDGNVTETRLTENIVLDSAPRYTELGKENVLVWYSEGNFNVLSLSSNEVSTVFDESVGATDIYSVSQSAGDITYIIWSQSVGEQVAFYGAVYDGFEWGEPVLLGEATGKALNPSAIVDADGTMFVAYNNVVQEQVKEIIEETDEEFTYYTDVQTDLALLKVYQNSNISLSDENLEIKAESAFPGETIPLTFNVKNNGTTSVEYINIYIDGELNSTVQVSLLPGKETSVTVDYIAPEIIAEKTISISSEPADSSDYDLSDNEISVMYGYTELEISDVLLSSTALNSTITACICNASAVDSGSFDIVIRENDENGAIVCTQTCENLSSGEVLFISQEISNQLITFDGNGVKQYHIEVLSDNEEYLLGNNKDIAVFTQDDNSGITYSLLQETVENEYVNTYVTLQNNEFLPHKIYAKIEILDENGSVIGFRFNEISLSEKETFTVDENVYFSGEYYETKITILELENENISLRIPRSIKNIGEASFENCDGVSEIIIPETVTDIALNAFNGCNNLTIVCFPDSVAHAYCVENSIPYTFYKINPVGNTTIDYKQNYILTTNLCCDNFESIVTATGYEIVSSPVNNMTFYGTGSTIEMFEEEKIGDYILVVSGDINGDSVCDVLDAMHVALVSNGHRTLDGAYAMAADSNSDDIVDVTDYQSIVNKAVS